VSTQPESRERSWASYLPHIGRGFLMGGADIIPGVSGGTIALILGIYRRLVAAISHFDLEFLGHVRGGKLKQAAAHVDLWFLAALGSGIATGIVSLASLMHSLLTHEATRSPTLAVFFGLILASGVIVGQMVDRWSVTAVLVCTGGAAFAFWITGLQATSVEPSYPYIFLCGMVAICAMILPGISGAYILLLLGMYLHVTGAIKGLPKGQLTQENLLTIFVFLTGCTVGILTFSKILRWLLAHYESVTMALLCGFMLGSLRKIWPFQRDLTPHLEELKLKQYDNVLPAQVDSRVAVVLVLAVVAAGFVFLLDWLSKGGRREPT
jgi:putative membrane protein